MRGYKEEATATTPFDRVVCNDLYRFQLITDVLSRVSKLGPEAAYIDIAKQRGVASGTRKNTAARLA